MIVGLLSVQAVASAHHAQEASAVPGPIPAIAVPIAAPPATSVYPLHLSVDVEINGTETVVHLPRGAQPLPLVQVPAGTTAEVAVSVSSAEPASGATAWVNFAPETSRNFQLPQLELGFGGPFSLASRTTVQFTVPASDLQSGSLPVIVLGAQEGTHLVTYGVVQLVPSP
jgi:hypothetical protein